MSPELEFVREPECLSIPCTFLLKIVSIILGAKS